MENRRLDEDITAGFGNYLTQKDQQYSRELSEVRPHLEERVKEVKTDLKDDIKDVKEDIKGDIQGVKTDLKDDIQKVRGDFKGSIIKLKDFHRYPRSGCSFFCRHHRYPNCQISIARKGD